MDVTKVVTEARLHALARTRIQRGAAAATGIDALGQRGIQWSTLGADRRRRGDRASDEPANRGVAEGAL